MQQEWHIKRCFHHLQLSVTFLVKKHKLSRQYRNIYVAPDEASENVNFQASEKEQRGVLEQYKTRPVEQKRDLKDVTLLEFATGWNWRGNNYTKRGARDANLLWSMFGHDICLIEMNRRFMKNIVMLK
jgi:hypothetical protein